MKRSTARSRRRGTILLMMVGLLAMLFIIVSAYIILARFERQTMRLVGQGDQQKQIVNTVENVAMAALRDSAAGAASVTGAGYAQIPGYADPVTTGAPSWSAAWLASNEPVLVPGALQGRPASFVQQAATSFGVPATGKRLTDFMLDTDGPATTPAVYVVPADPNNTGSLSPDTLANSRQPFMDADGDGISDSYFAGAALLTELANAMGRGRSVRAAGIHPEQLDPNNTLSDPNYALWQQFDQFARYMVAVRIISHGGMVQLAADPSLAPADIWNREFVERMFQWIEHPNDVEAGWVLDFNQDLLILQNLTRTRDSVEPVLRRRGGLLASYRGGGSSGEAMSVGLPPALYDLQDRFPSTVNPTYDAALKVDNWQRFNLASAQEWTAWRQATSVDPNAFNALYPTFPNSARMGYVPRQLLTTVNSSDELAREQDATASTAFWNTGAGRPGIDPGALKFYLGKIADPNVDPGSGVVLGAFKADGSFNLDTIDDYPLPQGQMIVRELAAYYDELLAGYEGWGGALNATEVVSRSEQAYMLAVNTVAFAAPRDPNGMIDVVYYDVPPGDRYIGYGPQLYFTQALANQQWQQVGQPQGGLKWLEKPALAVELYYPDEPDPNAWDKEKFTLDDRFALNLSQFAITLDTTYPPPLSSLQFLDQVFQGQYRLSGRNFATIAIRQEGPAANDVFDPYADGEIHTWNLSFRNGPVEVRLYKASAAGGLFLVDKIEATSAGWTSQSRGRLANMCRDTNGMYANPGAPSYLGIGNQDPNREARWRCVRFHATDLFDPNNPNGIDPNDTNLVRNLARPTLGFAFADLDPSLSPQLPPLASPAVPLYLMNAGLGYTSTQLHGVNRPRSFPTVGFLLFVPRYSHRVSSAAPQPMNEILNDRWNLLSHDYSLTSYPADFGHLPIFDNTQQESSTLGGFDKTGRVPWGLLVFDYFTTLNPEDPDGDPITPGTVDPYRVPGRININVAPWYVLAGLPLIGPNGGNPNTADLPLPMDASPAFWSARSGVLAGAGQDGTRRWSEWMDTSGAVGGQWYRLGPYLAQAAAAYRDRMQYIPYVPGNPTTYLYDTHLRSSATAPYRPTMRRYGSPRGSDDQSLNDPNTTRRGFLSLGELANVKGFDGSTNFGGADAVYTVLGGYGDPQAGGDFFKAVSLLALLDTQFLTTRSNTFTVYMTLTDRQNPQASVRSQVTVDRSSLLPRLVWHEDWNGNTLPDPPGVDGYTLLGGDAQPEIIGQRQVSYFNSQYDE